MNSAKDLTASRQSLRFTQGDKPLQLVATSPSPGSTPIDSIMQSNRHTLVNFLNHGTMPFVGRQRLVREIVAFHEEGRFAERLRSMVVTAEAGMGKSRLIEEVLPHVRRAGGIALHVKLVPKGTASVVSLLARTLATDPSARPILQRREIADDLSSLLPALRTLARLRPLLIVLEDVHLLHEHSLDEAATLLQSLADEPLCVLAVCRPTESALLGLLESSLHRHAHLAPLGVDDVETLWSYLFSAPPPRPDVAEALHAVCHGSPLALRTVLREGVSSGMIVPGGSSGESTRVDLAGMLQSGRASTMRIGMGMAASLTGEEREAALRLGLLGEVFAREAGLALLPGVDGAQLIDRLLYRGVLHPLRTVATPLPGLDRESIDFPASRRPLLGFTHTLLHQYCLDSAESYRVETAGPLAANTPLYSITPVASFLNAVADGEMPNGDLYNALLRCSNALHEIILSTGWGRSRELVELLSRAIERVQPELEPDQYLELSVSALYKRSIIAESEGEDELWQELLERATGRVLTPATLVQARLRISAIAKNPHAPWGDGTYCREAIDQIESLAAQWPELRHYLDYRQFMCLIGVIGTINGDDELVERAEQYYDALRAETDRQHVREMLDTWFLPALIQRFATPEELEKRRAQFRVVEGIPRAGSPAVHLADHTILFLYTVGDFDALLRRVDESLALFHIRNVHQLYVRARVRKLAALGGIGVDLEEIEHEAERITADEVLPEYTASQLGAGLSTLFWLRGDSRWRTFALEPVSSEELHPVLRLLLDVESGVQQLPDEIDITSPVLRLDHLVARTAYLALLLKSRTPPSAQSVRQAFGECVEWCRERRLAGFLDGLLKLAAGHVDERKMKEWRGVLDEVQRERHALADSAGDGRIALSMLGVVEIDSSDGVPRKVSGARMKTVLALMVANALAGSRLSLEEFALLAAGDEEADPEAARNNLYVRLHSLRKLLGHDAIITEAGEAPRLDEEQVRVDLIEIERNLREARSLQSAGKLGKTATLVQRALHRTGSAVPYPGLYDSFFDAARNDYDVMLRDTVLMLAEALAREGDHESVVDLLGPALERTPDDEEMAELLCTSLTALGRKSQAEWARRILARALDGHNGYSSTR